MKIRENKMLQEWHVTFPAKLLQFAGALAKLRKATIGFVMSVRPHGTTKCPLDMFT